MTETADHAISQAIAIAMKAHAKLILVHILDNKTSSAEKIEQKLNDQATDIWEKTGLECEAIVKPGSVFDVIPSMAREKEFDLIVIGGHGIKGIMQIITGPDLLKLVAKVSAPVLVVHEKSPIVEEFRRIVLPVSSHESFLPAIDAVLFFAGLFKIEVHLYSIFKPGFEWPEQLLLNLDETIKTFEEKGVQYKRIKEDQNSYSMGYAKQTIKYAQSVQADNICVMSLPSKEYYYFAQSDKETLLLNEFNIPVLFAGGTY